jgi:hypothetical protein
MGMPTMKFSGRRCWRLCRSGSGGGCGGIGFGGSGTGSCVIIGLGIHPKVVTLRLQTRLSESAGRLPGVESADTHPVIGSRQIGGGIFHDRHISGKAECREFRHHLVCAGAGFKYAYLDYVPTVIRESSRCRYGLFFVVGMERRRGIVRVVRRGRHGRIFGDRTHAFERVLGAFSLAS